MSDYLVSLIRTWVPVAVGVAITWLGAQLGVDIDSTEAAAAVTGVVVAVYYAVARILEDRWPQLGLLLGRASVPAYGTPSPEPE